MLVRFRWSTTITVACLVLGTLVACSGAEDAPASPEAAFCDALSGAYAGCGGGTTCGTSIAVDCTKLASLLSPSVLAGAKDCVESTACGSDPLACLGKALGDAEPSAAQNKLATDYCTSCSAVSGAACETAFFGTANVPGLAFVLLPFGDGPLEAVDSACTKSSLGKTACQAAFTTCLSATTTKFLATSISADSARCLLDGIASGLKGVGAGDGGAPDDGGAADDGGPATPAPPCGPDTCAGCCDADGKCSTTDRDTACGRGGAACAGCGGSKTCEQGQCIDPSCKASCTAGCCTVAGCQPGTAPSACGKGGAACSACGTGQQCSGGACTLDANVLFDFVAVGARVPATNQTGGSWDAFSGLPDPFLKATSGAATGETPNVSNTLAPLWNKVVLSGLSAATLKASLNIELRDSDVAADDHMGGCAVPLNDAAFDGALHSVACPKVADGVALSVDYRLKAR
jgi:hypothetical protein